MNTSLTTQQTQTALDQLQESFKKNEGHVAGMEFNKWLKEFGQLRAACDLTGVKLYDGLEEVRLFEGLVMALQTHGYKTFEIHFPDGDKYETVMRYRKDNNRVHSFSYKL